MMKSHKFFRYVWRINAVLILLAAGAAVLGVAGLLIQEFGFRAAQHREAEAGIAVNAPDAKSDLVLGRASIVEGTQVMRAELQRPSGEAKFSSGYGSETRNLLFIEPGLKAGHWLLPDNDHILVDTCDVTDQKESNEKRVVASTVLVKPAPSSEATTGKLLLFDPPGKRIVEVADHVRTIQVTSIKSGELSVLYERDKRLLLDVFDPKTLSKLRGQEIEVPLLK